MEAKYAAKEVVTEEAVTKYKLDEVGYLTAQHTHHISEASMGELMVLDRS